MEERERTEVHGTKVQKKFACQKKAGRGAQNDRARQLIGGKTSSRFGGADKRENISVGAGGKVKVMAGEEEGILTQERRRGKQSREQWEQLPSNGGCRIERGVHKGRIGVWEENKKQGISGSRTSNPKLFWGRRRERNQRRRNLKAEIAWTTKEVLGPHGIN